MYAHNDPIPQFSLVPERGYQIMANNVIANNQSRITPIAITNQIIAKSNQNVTMTDRGILRFPNTILLRSAMDYMANTKIVDLLNELNENEMAILVSIANMVYEPSIAPFTYRHTANISQHFTTLPLAQIWKLQRVNNQAVIRMCEQLNKPPLGTRIRQIENEMLEASKNWQEILENFKKGNKNPYTINFRPDSTHSGQAKSFKMSWVKMAMLCAMSEFKIMPAQKSLKSRLVQNLNNSAYDPANIQRQIRKNSVITWLQYRIKSQILTHTDHATYRWKVFYYLWGALENNQLAKATKLIHSIREALRGPHSKKIIDKLESIPTSKTCTIKKPDKLPEYLSPDEILALESDGNNITFQAIRKIYQYLKTKTIEESHQNIQELKSCNLESVPLTMAWPPTDEKIHPFQVFTYHGLIMLEIQARLHRELLRDYLERIHELVNPQSGALSNLITKNITEYLPNTALEIVAESGNRQMPPLLLVPN